MRFAVLISTGGAVLDRSLKFDFFRKNLIIVYSDRVCGGIQIAKKYNIKNSILNFTSNRDFSNELLKDIKKQNIDFIFLFYTRLLEGDILFEYQYRIINLHPALLPVFKGLNSIEASLRSKIFFLGTTIHFIDKNIDSGFFIIQSIIPRHPLHTDNFIRHKIFIHQCRTFLQVIRWIMDRRLRIENEKPLLSHMQYENFEFIPSLDKDIKSLSL
jgi:folate-dependent phosphoribosylglycinamide formyltransferase PurN